MPVVIGFSVVVDVPARQKREPEDGEECRVTEFECFVLFVEKPVPLRVQSLTSGEEY